MKFRQLLYRGVLWKGIFLITSLILNIFIARLFEAASSGWIFYITNLFAFFLLLFSFSMESSISFFLAGGQINNEKLSMLALFWTVLAAVLTFVLSALFLPAKNPEIGNISIVAVMYVAGNLLLTFFGAMFYAKNNFSAPNVTPALVNIILILLAIIIDTDAGWLSKQEFIRFYFYSFLACGLLLFTLFIKTYCNWRRLATFVSVIELRHLLRYSFLSFLSNIIAFLLFRVDYFFVEKYCTNSDLGNYIQVSKLSQLFFVVPGILASIVFPMTAGGMKKEVNSHLPVLSRIIFFFFGNACIFLVLTGKFIFPYFFGDSFTSMYQIFLLMIPGILGLAIIFPLTAYYAGKKKMGVNIRGSLYTVLLMIVADFVVVPVYKITGATVVCSLSYLMYGVYVIFHFGKEYGIAFKDFIIIRRSDFRFITGKMI